MKKQVITWTAIPRGPHDAVSPADRLGVSVFISPRLQESGSPTLHDFHDWLLWPKTLAGVSFKVHIEGGPTLPAHVISAKPDLELWQALFTSATPITPFAFEDRTDQLIRSYPVSRIQRDIQQRYLSVIQTVAKNPGQLPSLRHLYATFNPIAGGQRYNRALDEVVDSELRRYKALPPQAQPGGVAGDYHQVDQFLHRKTAHPYTADPATHPAKPRKSDLYDLFDFHKMISALGNYPELLVKLGLVVELEIPFDAAIPTGAAATTISVIPSHFNAAPHVRPRTHYLLDSVHGFRARPAPGSYLTDELLLHLSDKNSFDITQTDIDGSAVKLLGMAANLSEQVSRPIAGLPTDQGVPSLRSAGIALIHTGRAYDLAQRFKAAATQNAAAETNAPVELYADDLVRGYAIDIFTHRWLSLNLRQGLFTFKRSPGSKRKQIINGEGFVAMATAQVPGGTPSDLYLHEQLCRWNGWSLAAPRPITPIGVAGSGETPQEPPDAANPDITRYGLVVAFSAPSGTLPKLRFGHVYRARARMVDLAGHSIETDAPGALLPAVQTPPIRYARWEPLAAPALALRHSIKGSPGESMARLVVRSDFDRSVDHYFADQAAPPYNKDAERHFLPPKTSQMMAETHGMFDNPPPAGKTWYQVITETDVSLPMDPQPPHDPLPHDTDHLGLPYLPDPLGQGATFVGLPGYPAGQPFTAPTWGGHWPYQNTFRMVLKGIDATAVPQPPLWQTAPAPLLTVELPKGEMVIVRYSSRPITSMLLLMALWEWIVQAGLAGVFAKAVQAGLAWLLTPYHEITLVHAVQRPLIKPGFSPRLRAMRQTGETSATLFDLPMPISGRSTIKLDLQARWFEPNDDVGQAGPGVREYKAHVSEIPLDYATTALTFPSDDPAALDADSKYLTHELSSTKYHRVAYTAIATTRYREYFPFTKAEIAANPALLTRASDTGSIAKPDPSRARATSIVDAAHALPRGVIDVPSSARPQSPNLLYVTPTFGHESAAGSDGITALRRGGGLRVYLERPWYSSGEGELLGVVLPPAQPKAGGISIRSFGYTAADPSHVTQWGLDPIVRSHNAPTPIAPTPNLFTRAARTATGLSIDEQPGVQVAVAGHEVAYDADRRLWYADIELSGGLAYYPFIRLVLARYQPNSIPGTHLSRLVLADFAQIAPDRMATVTFNSKDAHQMRITVAGPAPYRTTNSVVVSLEQQLTGADGGDELLGWIPVGKGALTLRSTTVKNETLWSGEYTVPPLPTPPPPLRLVIREFELYPSNGEEITIAATPATRLVYAEVLDILLPT